MKKLLIISLFFICISCGTLPQANHYTIAKTDVTIGSMGVKPVSLRKTEFITSGNVQFKDKFKVTTIVRTFDKKTYKNYQKALKGLAVTPEIILVDSLKHKPRYVEIKLSNKVKIAEMINTDHKLLMHLKNAADQQMVLGIKAVLPKEYIQQLLQADACYLQTEKDERIFLHVFNKGKEIAAINMDSITTFEYQLAGFCWIMTPTKKVEIARLIEKGEQCLKPTKENAQILIRMDEKNSVKF